MPSLTLFLLLSLFAAGAHMLCLWVSARLLGARVITWSACALLAAVSTLLLAVLRNYDVFDVSSSAQGLLAIGVSLLLQGLLGVLVLGPTLTQGSVLLGGYLRAAAVAAVAFFVLVAGCLGLLSVLDRLAAGG